jgi:hypothetical protein
MMSYYPSIVYPLHILKIDKVLVLQYQYTIEVSFCNILVDFSLSILFIIALFSLSNGSLSSTCFQDFYGNKLKSSVGKVPGSIRR